MSDYFSSGKGRSMLKGMEHIRNAEQLLADHETPIRKRLLDAGRQFWSATFYEEEWPAELQQASNRVKARLLSNGDLPNSISAMDDDTLEETAEELLMLTKALEASVAPHVR